MNRVVSRIADDIASSLAPWLNEKLGDAENAVIHDVSRPADGGSSETYFLSVSFVQGGHSQRKSWVLRIQATDYQVYEDPSVETQYRVMSALSELGQVPVPTMYWFESSPEVLGAPFFLMERVNGFISSPFHHSTGYLTDLSGRQRAKAWQSAITTIAAIHDAPIEHFAFLAEDVTGNNTLRAELKKWALFMTWSGIDIRPEQERALSWLEKNLPESNQATLAWGDARPGNMVFSDEQCKAVLDWETVSLAGAETDLAWWLLYDWMVTEGMDNEPLPGWGSREDTISLWEETTGRRLEQLHWHDVFAAWRYSLISDRARRLIRLRDPDNPIGANRHSLAVDRLNQLSVVNENNKDTWSMR